MVPGVTECSWHPCTGRLVQAETCWEETLVSFVFLCTNVAKRKRLVCQRKQKCVDALSLSLLDIQDSFFFFVCVSSLRHCAPCKSATDCRRFLRLRSDKAQQKCLGPIRGRALLKTQQVHCFVACLGNSLHNGFSLRWQKFPKGSPTPGLKGFFCVWVSFVFGFCLHLPAVKAQMVRQKNHPFYFHADTRFSTDPIKLCVGS